MPDAPEASAPLAPIGPLAAIDPTRDGEEPAPALAAEPPPGAELPPAPGEDSPWRRIHGNWVLVDSLETLGHFADWLEISPTRLRQINKLSRSRRLRMGQKLKLDFSRVSPETFLLRRMEYHKGIEEDFFGAYRITGTTQHALGRGDSLWVLSHKRYGVPVWLIQRYNPDLDLTALRPGIELTIPTVEPLPS
jgi:membrane-bound lytic murein transglycosylase D